MLQGCSFLNIDKVASIPPQLALMMVGEKTTPKADSEAQAKHSYLCTHNSCMGGGADTNHLKIQWATALGKALMKSGKYYNNPSGHVTNVQSFIVGDNRGRGQASSLIF